MNKQIILVGVGEAAGELPVADGAGGFSWQTVGAVIPNQDASVNNMQVNGFLLDSNQAVLIAPDAVTGAVNYFILANAATGASPAIEAAGEDANVGMRFVAKGGGVIEFDSAVKLTNNVGFFGSSPTNQPTVSGSRGGNAALLSLVNALAALGLIVNSTSA